MIPLYVNEKVGVDADGEAVYATNFENFVTNTFVGW